MALFGTPLQTRQLGNEALLIRLFHYLDVVEEECRIVAPIYKYAANIKHLIVFF